MRQVQFYILLLLCCALSGCSMIESNPYDVHITGEKQLTCKHINLIESATAGKPELRFAVISDSQRFYDETRDAVNAINARGDVDFVLHGGDLTEYGATKEFLWQRDILEKLSMPFVCVIGNHDCLATGLEAYQSLFGPLDFAFTAGDVRFVCLNTNALEFDYSQAVPDFSFIRSEIAAPHPSSRKTVVLMHARPYSEQFNNNVATEFHALLTQLPNLQFCIYGHGHNVTVDNLFNDGVIYYQCASTKKRSYLLFTIHSDNDAYDYEVVEF